MLDCGQWGTESESRDNRHLVLLTVILVRHPSPTYSSMAEARSPHVKLASGPRLISENREGAEWEVRVFLHLSGYFGCCVSDC